MKTIKQLIFLLLFISTRLTANEPITNNTASQTREFSITITTVVDGKDEKTTEKIKLTGSYTSKEKEPYKIVIDSEKTDAKETTRTFEEPLNIDNFTSTITELIKKNVEKLKDKECYILRENIMEIYLWLISAEGEFSGKKISGMLHFNSFVKVYSGNQNRIPINKTNSDFQDIIKQFNLDRDKEIEKIKTDYLANIGNRDTKRFLTSLSGLNIKADKANLILDFVQELNANDAIKLDSLKSVSPFKEIKLEDTTSKKIIKLINSFVAKKDKTDKTDSIFVNSDSIILKSLIKPKIDNWIKNSFTKFQSDPEKFLSDSLTESIKKYAISEKTIKTLLESFKTELTNIKSIQENLKKTKDQKELSGLWRVTDVSIQIEKGFIENIAVEISNNRNDKMIFENNFPIGFSSKYNFDKFDNVRLFIRNDEDDINEDKFILLSQVLPKYSNVLENNLRDYSPGDITIKHIKPDDTPAIALEKEQTINLFDGRVYTDFFGLGAKNPNGLVQTELRRRFNLFTHRYRMSSLVNIGYVNYINLFIGITKLEEKERYLNLRNDRKFINNQLVSPSYATTMDFIRYEAYSIGAESNLFLLDVPNGKITFMLDLGLRYSRVPLTDSTQTIENDNYKNEYINDLPPAALITWYPKLTAEIKADNRLGFDLNFFDNNSTLLSNNLYKAVRSYEKSKTDVFYQDPGSRSNFAFEFNERYLPDEANPGNKLFVRFRLTWQYQDMNTFYPQFQLGYAYKFKFTKNS